MEHENPLELSPIVSEQDELTVDAIDLGGIDLLEEDIVPCTCCGFGCNCSEP
jgi:hypothetical protein